MGIVVVYRSPSKSVDSPFKDEGLLSYFTYLSSVSSKIVIVGDFNAPGIDWLSHSTTLSDLSFGHKLVQTLGDSFLHQHVTEPTRF